VSLIRKEYGQLFYNAVTLWEPRKKEMMKWLADPDHTLRPNRVADVVAIGKGSKVYDGLVDLNEGKIVKWELTEGVQPLVCHICTTLRWNNASLQFRSPWKICRL
jgi:primary-amine oxidase